MKKFLESIEEKLKKNIDIETIKIIDNSDKHRKHKFFDSKKSHLYLEIGSVYLSQLKRLDAQRKIMKILDQELKSQIHALEIKIK